MSVGREGEAEVSGGDAAGGEEVSRCENVSRETIGTDKAGFTENISAEAAILGDNESGVGAEGAVETSADAPIVSRETSADAVEVEPEPAFLAELANAHTAEGADKLRAFAADLVERGELLGLIGPLELPRLWTRHIINSALLAPLLKSCGSLADIGTGGGFPGIVLAALRPDVRVRLIEPMERRCNWLQEQVDRLELANTTVLRGRAEEYRDAFEVDQVTARAVTALSKLVPITAPLLCEGGEMLFLKGAGIDAEIVVARKAFAKYKVREHRVELLGEGLTETTRVFRGTVQRQPQS